MLSKLYVFMVYYLSIRNIKVMHIKESIVRGVIDE